MPETESILTQRIADVALGLSPPAECAEPLWTGQPSVAMLPNHAITAVSLSQPGVLARAVIFRLAAILLGLAPLAFVELVLAGLHVGQPELSDDPFVGFSSVRPLFTLSSDGTRYEIAPGRLTQFAPDSFAAQKDSNEFRIFVLGGSTVQGNPYSIPTSFTTWLELSLQAADPTRHWEVVNCGGISYATYRLVPIMQELVNYAPDMFIVYEGQNEFLEDRTYEHIKRAPAAVARTIELASQLRLVNALRAGYVAVTGTGMPPRVKDRQELAADVEALLDYRGGMALYHRDEGWRQGVIAHFEFNLRRMVEIARHAGVRLLLMNPVCNLRDSPPFKSEHRDGLDITELGQWESLWSEARQFLR